MNARNKAILSLMWNLDSRHLKKVLLKNKHKRLKEKYSGWSDFSIAKYI